MYANTTNHRGYSFSETRNPTTFDFETDYNHELLVHLSCGGGTRSHELLRHLQIQNEVRELIVDHIRQLPQNYIAVHIRHSDLTTDYEPLLEELETKQGEQKILVCSDNSKVIEEFRKKLGDFVIFNNELISKELTLSPIRHSRKNYSSEEEMYKATVVALQDLFALANAGELMILKHNKGLYSGFSMLARYLHMHKDIIRSMLAVNQGTAGQRAFKEGT